jgi:hypothetical protein
MGLAIYLSYWWKPLSSGMYPIQSINWGFDLGIVNHLDGHELTIHDSYDMYQYFFKISLLLWSFLKLLNTTSKANPDLQLALLRAFSCLDCVLATSSQWYACWHQSLHCYWKWQGLARCLFLLPPFTPQYRHYQKWWIVFFTSVCAIVGVVVTTMGMINQYLHQQGNNQKTADGLIW